ncbi:hypothetical protein [Rhizobium sp. Leaf391]|nr:hypothetical protein [Rhizobium sp. Leaf391]
MDISHSAAHVVSDIWIVAFSKAAIRQGDLRPGAPDMSSVAELTAQF